MKRLYLYAFISFCVFFCEESFADSSVWDGNSTDTSWYDESLSEYHIQTAAQLKGLADLANNNSTTFSGKKIILDSDIDLANHPWIPIANGCNHVLITKSFQGTFSGEGHSITNIFVSNSSNPYGSAALAQYYSVGLFGAIENSSISKLIISGSIEVGKYGCNSAGCLVGYAKNSDIQQISCNSNIEIKDGFGGSKLYMGGIVGEASTSTLSRISCSGEMIFHRSAADYYIGGIAGVSNKLERCSSDFKIDVPVWGGSAISCYIGGLSGQVQSVKDVIFTGSINAYNNSQTKNSFVGGISGKITGEVANIISAPTKLMSQTTQPALFLGMIVPNTQANGASFTNAYYLSGITDTPGNSGLSITEDQLKSGNPIGGFDTDIWSFNQGSLPQITSIIDVAHEDDEDDSSLTLKYEYDYSDMTAKVVQSDENDYKGKIVIPKEVTKEGYVFNVTAIGINAFYNCSEITDIKLPESIIAIEFGAFSGCSNLTSVYIPSSVTSIGKSTIEGYGRIFNNCAKLTSIIVDENNPKYDSRENCNSLIESATNILIEGCSNSFVPVGIETIGHSAFEQCENLSSISIPSSVTKIEEFAFCGCAGLKTLTLSEGLRSIGYYAFSKCKALSNIKLPESLTSIDGGAFDNCENLLSVNIPNQIHVVNNYAFCNCKLLSSIVLPYDLVYIGESAFRGCISIESINIPDKAIEIMPNAFIDCKALKYLTLGESVNSIMDNAFANCSDLEDVYCLSTEVPTTGDNVFDNVLLNKVTLHVPDNNISDYRGVSPWNEFGSILMLSNKCETPTIAYSEGKLIFSCETEGVTFVSTISDSDISTFYDSEIPLSAKYIISVYATATGRGNSEIATATLCWIDSEPKAGGITESVAEIKTRPVLIQNQGGVITISGTADETGVNVYSLEGKIVGSGHTAQGKAVVKTNLFSGDTAIIKIGECSIKILLK